MADTDGSVKIGVDLETGGAENDLMELLRNIHKTLKSISGSANKMIELFSGAKQGIDAINSSLSTMSTNMQNVSTQANTTFDNSIYNQLQTSINNLTTSIGTLAGKLQTAATAQNQFRSSTKSMSTSNKIFEGIKHSIKELPKTFSKATRSVKDFFNNLRRGANSSEKSFKKLLKSIMRYVLGFRSMYFLVRKIRQYGVEALQALALESDKVNSDMSRLYTSFMQLKYSMASFIQPILSLAVPALEKLAAAGVRASEALGKVLAVLAGQNYIYKANKVQRDYAASLQKTAKAAKEAKKQLGEYDKLKVIQKNDNAGADSGLGDSALGDLFSKEAFDTSKYEEFFKKIKDMWKNADFTELGMMLGTRVRDGLNKIDWNVIKETLERVGKSVATFLNGIFGTPGLAKSIGKTLGETLNSAISIAFGFVENFNWKAAGQFLADGLNKFIKTVDWVKWGKTIRDLINGILDFLITAIEETDWDEVGTAIGKFLVELDFASLIPKLGKLLWLVIKSAFEVVNAMAEEAPFETLMLTLFGLFRFTGLGGLLVGLLGDALSYVITQIGAWILSLGPEILSLGSAIIGGIVADIILIGMAIKNWIDLLEMDLEPGELMNALYEFLWGDFDQVFSTFKEEFTKTGEKLMAFIEDIFIGDLSKAVDDFIDFGVSLVKGLGLGILSTITFLFNPIKSMVVAVIDWVKDLFGIHSPSTVFANFGTMLIQGLINGIASMTGKLLNTFKSIFDKILNMVSGFTDSFKKGFETVKTATKSVANSTVGVFNKLIDLAQGGINSIGDGFSKFKIDVPDWVPGIGGKKYNFNLPKINLKKIPALAEGAVIPPNKKFLAQLGDQKHGTNIEAPLETIKQALQEVLGGTVNSDATIDLTVNLDGTVIYNRLVEIDRKKIKQSGKSGFGGVR